MYKTVNKETAISEFITMHVLSLQFLLFFHLVQHLFNLFNEILFRVPLAPLSHNLPSSISLLSPLQILVR